RCRAADRCDQVAELLRTVVQPVAVEIVELERLVVRAARIKPAELVGVVVVEASIEALDDGRRLAVQVVADSETRRHGITHENVLPGSRLCASRTSGNRRRTNIKPSTSRGWAGTRFRS